MKTRSPSFVERWRSFKLLRVFPALHETVLLRAAAGSLGGRQGRLMKISFSMVEKEKAAAAAGTNSTYGVRVNGRLTGPAVSKRVSEIMR